MLHVAGSDGGSGCLCRAWFLPREEERVPPAVLRARPPKRDPVHTTDVAELERQIEARRREREAAIEARNIRAMEKFLAKFGAAAERRRVDEARRRADFLGEEEEQQQEEEEARAALALPPQDGGTDGSHGAASSSSLITASRRLLLAPSAPLLVRRLDDFTRSARRDWRDLAGGGSSSTGGAGRKRKAPGGSTTKRVALTAKKAKKDLCACASCLQKGYCGACAHCLDKPRFGGINKMRQACMSPVPCLLPLYGSEFERDGKKWRIADMAYNAGARGIDVYYHDHAAEPPGCVMHSALLSDLRSVIAPFVGD